MQQHVHGMMHVHIHSQAAREAAKEEKKAIQADMGALFNMVVDKRQTIVPPGEYASSTIAVADMVHGMAWILAHVYMHICRFWDVCRVRRFCT